MAAVVLTALVEETRTPLATSEVASSRVMRVAFIDAIPEAEPLGTGAGEV